MDKEEFTSEKMKETIEKVSRDQTVRKVVFSKSTKWPISVGQCVYVSWILTD